MTDRTLRLTASARIEAAAASPKRGQFSGTAYSGSLLKNSSWPSPVVLDLTGLAIADSLPLVVDHRTALADRLGSVKATIVRGTIYVEGRIVEGASAAADRVLALAAAGEPIALSVGVNPSRVERVPVGRSVSIGSQTFTGPIDVIRVGTLTEISVVGIGADAEASARVAAQKQGIPAMSQEVGNMEIPTPEADTAAILAAERTRVVDIRAAFKSLDADDVCEQLIATGASAEAGRAAALGILRARRTANSYIPPYAMGRTGGAPEGRLVAEAALAQICGYDNDATVRAFGADGPRIMEAARSTGVRSLRAWLDYTARLDPAGSGYDPIAGRGGRLEAAFSTASLAIMESSIPKLLRAEFELQPASCDGIADWRPVSDFRETSLYRLVVKGALEQVGKDGEIKHGSLEEAAKPMRLGTYARMFGITRPDLINDNIGAFAQIPRILVYEAMRLRADKFVELLTAESATFFPTNNSKKNYISGSTSALGTVGLGLAVAAMREQVDEDGRVLNMRPFALVVPAELEGTARELVNSMTIQRAADDPGPVSNWAKDLNLAIAVEARLSNAKEWYLVGAPVYSPLVIGTLNGRREPIVEFKEPPANMLGQTIRGYYDFAIALCEHRAWVKSAGQ